MESTEVKVALVTGAATGLGRACALKLAQAGFTIAANYRTKKDEAETLLQELRGGRHTLFQADISDPAACAGLVSEVLATYGTITALVNVAGRFTEQDIVSPDFASWNSSWSHSLATNLIAPVNLCYLVAQAMISRSSGKIVNISSRGAFRGEPAAPAYGAAKSGLNSASQSLAVALAPHGISVYAIAPGWVETPSASPRIGADAIAQIPLGRVGRPTEVANLVAFLLGDETDYLTGAIIDANGASYLRN